MAFFVVWQSVRALEPLADLMGPGTRQTQPANSDSSPLENVTARMHVDIARAPAGVWTMLRGDVRTLLGGRRIPDELAAQGRDWLGWAMGLAGVLAVGRLGWLARRGDRPMAEAAMGWYVLGVGVIGKALTAFVAELIAQIEAEVLAALLPPVEVDLEFRINCWAKAG